MPRAPAIDASTRLLVVAPHPDDESLATGMLIQRCLAEGGSVDVVLLTDGDDNPWPQRWLEKRIIVGAAGRRRWGGRRRREVVAALARLGVGPARLHAMGWHDMQVTTQLRRHYDSSIGQLRAVLTQVRPTLVVIPDLGDRHPDHGAAHVLTRLAMLGTGIPAEVLTYMVHGTEASPPEALIVPDGDAERQRVKTAAVLEHATQMVLSRKRMLGIASRPERFDRPPPPVPVGATLRLPWHPGPWARARLRVVLADGQGARHWTWRKAPLVRDGDDWLLALPPVPGPAFVKLTADLATPWIYDRYGWVCRDPDPIGLVARPPG
ncbi:PIG-L deacetylase family protein [Luteibacter aegosomatissinici]|uniref:PIG-L deacetylase family protein n=1 Tax=Luteibacter aegosomatissinici TaxID=2911539 RepID=UPI001FF8AF08|nr:PIG-L family deacetylase [Luteibacter aegosomatissinici]UPG93089.1 PIG-L family deacetylase [Luteibacter aegosomatissinici]